MTTLTLENEVRLNTSFIATFNPETHTYVCTSFVNSNRLNRLSPFVFETNYSSSEPNFWVRWTNPVLGKEVTITTVPLTYAYEGWGTVDSLTAADRVRLSLAQWAIEPDFRLHQMAMGISHPESEREALPLVIHSSYESSGIDVELKAFFDESPNIEH